MRRTYIVTVKNDPSFEPTFEQVEEDIKLMFSEQYGIDSGVKIEEDEDV